MTPSVAYERVDPVVDLDRLVRFLCAGPWPFHAQPSLDRDAVAGMVFESSSTSSYWGIVDGADVALVRLLDLDDIDGAAGGNPLFDLRVASAARGCGVGRTTVTWLTDLLFDAHPSLNRVEATTRIDNGAMRSVLERCGYVLEGRIRESWPTTAGDRLDTAIYGVLRSDRSGAAVTPAATPGQHPLATGRCMCGAVTFAVRAPLREVFHCHCQRCRRFTGHHMAASAADAEAIEIDNASHGGWGGALGWYSPHPTVDYGFCRRCGSSLFWRAFARPDRVSICAGALDQPTGLRATQAWWVSESADYHSRDRTLVEHERDG